MKIEIEARSKANTIITMFWDNFQKSEPTFVMRDVIAIEIEKAFNKGVNCGYKASTSPE